MRILASGVTRHCNLKRLASAGRRPFLRPRFWWICTGGLVEVGSGRRTSCRTRLSHPRSALARSVIAIRPEHGWRGRQFGRDKLLDAAGATVPLTNRRNGGRLHAQLPRHLRQRAAS